MQCLNFSPPQLVRPSLASGPGWDTARHSCWNLFPHNAVALKPLGDGFIKLIRMTLAPIIFATVVVGIARMGDLKEVDESAQRR